MKVLQLNTWSARLGKSVVDLIKEEAPDIVCLQEMLSMEAEMPSMMGIPVEQLASETGYEHVFYSPVFKFKFMNQVARWGNCIISKQEMIKTNTIFTNLEFVEDFNFEEFDYNIRNLQHAVVDISGKKLNVLNHHGHHIPEHKDGDDSTLRQMKIIADYIDGLNDPVILAGDFNLHPNSKSLELINERLDNLPAKHNLKTTRNILTSKVEVCDYIFVSNDIKAKKFYMPDNIVSDHQALVLEFDI